MSLPTARKVLVIEDIPDTLSGTITELRLAGVEVETATNIADAVQRLSGMKYDVVLLDWRLPGEVDAPVDDDAGSSVLKKLQTDAAGANRNIPVIVVTAQRSGVDERQVGQYPSTVRVVSKLRPDQILEAISLSLGCEIGQR